MYKLCFRDTVYDFIDFIKDNKWKLLAALTFLVFGVILGIKNACGVKDAYGYLLSHNCGALAMIIGSRSPVAFFFCHLALFLVMAVVIILLSFNFFSSFLGYLILLLYSYIFSLYAALLVILFSGGFIPALILGLAPCFIIGYFVLSVAVTMSVNRGRDLKIYGFSNCNGFASFLKSTIPIFVVAVAICLLESVLTYILVLGLFI